MDALIWMTCPIDQSSLRWLCAYAVAREEVVLATSTPPRALISVLICFMSAEVRVSFSAAFGVHCPADFASSARSLIALLNRLATFLFSRRRPASSRVILVIRKPVLMAEPTEMANSNRIKGRNAGKSIA